MSNVILTVDGAEKIKEEILHIETIKLPELKESIRKARNDGADMKELAEQWDFYCHRVPSLKNMLSTAKIIDRPEPNKAGELTDAQVKQMVTEYSRSMEFRGYTAEEIFRLGMLKALEIAGIDIPDIVHPDNA